VAAERINRLDLADMPVIALARFVVVAHQALSADYQSQAILEPVCGAPDGARNAPDNDLGERILGENVAFVGQRLGLHVGECTNMWSVVKCSNT